MDIEFTAVGIKHQRQAFKAAEVKRGDVLTLVPEPTNVYDPKAILVYKDQFNIGYVPRKDNQEIGVALAAGRVQEVRCSVAWPAGFCVLVKISEEVSSCAD